MSRLSEPADKYIYIIWNLFEYASVRADGRVVMALRLGLNCSRSFKRSVVRKSVGVGFIMLSKLLLGSQADLWIVDPHSAQTSFWLLVLSSSGVRHKYPLNYHF